VGDVELLQKVWKLLERGPEMGLELNPSKCGVDVAQPEKPWRESPARIK